MSHEQNPGREVSVQPLNEEYLKSFHRLMDVFNPEPETQKELPLEIAAERFFNRAALTLADIRRFNLSPLNDLETEMLIAADKGLSPTAEIAIYDVTEQGTKRPRNTLSNVTLQQEVMLNSDIFFFKRLDFDYHPEREESFWASIPLIAERERGQEFGAAVKTRYEKFNERRRKEFRRQLGLPI